MRPLAVTLVLSLTSLTPLTAQGFPTPRAPQGNPITSAKALLGKALFFEEQMSSSNTMACATCHQFKTGGADHRALQADSIHPGPDGRFGTADDRNGSKGVIQQNSAGSYVPHARFGLKPQVTDRRAMSVINAWFPRRLFWDGRADDSFRDPVSNQIVLSDGAALESQAAGPPTNTTEMSHMGESWTGIAARIAKAQPLKLASNIPASLANYMRGKSYPDMFYMAFGTRDVTPARIIMAIATYERTLVSNQSPWDSFQRGNSNALTAAQQRGRRLFFDRRNACGSCHGGPMFTDNRFHYTGVRPGSEDIGFELVSRNGGDRGRMRTPSLRNVALRAPYFRNGRARTLADVVAFYTRGGDFNQRNKDRRIQRLPLSSGAQADLVAFLGALTDPRVAAETAPFDRPRLASETGRAPVLVGQSTWGSNLTAPSMIANEPSFIGNPNFTLGVRGALGGAPAVLVVDTATRPAPITIGGTKVYLPMTAGMMIVPVGNLSGSGAGNGYTSFSTAIPNDSRLIGAKVGAQWFVGDTGGGSILSATPAANITVF